MPPLSCSVDFETRATVDLPKTGVYPYAMHPDTDLMCMAYAFGDEEPLIWAPGEPFPERLHEHIRAGGEMRAWNAQFERVIWWHIGFLRFGWPEVTDSQWVCTAAEAAAMALPRGLDQCAAVLRIKDQKDKEGSRLMMQMTKPRDVLRDGRIVWWWDETRKQRLFAYCKQDVIVERRIAKAIRRLTPAERELFLLDQRINDRGILIDTPMVKAMQALVDEGLERINSRMRALTGGKVNDVNKVAQLKLWLASEDMPVGALDKDAIATLLAGDLPANLREGIELRAEGGRSSNAKLKSMINAACTDGCARGSLLYHGAGTGRWSARLIQTHNFPKGTIEDPERFLDAIMAGQYDYLNLFAPTLEIVSSNLRGCLRARPGHRLVAADYSGIEARVTNWHAGQADIVKLFADGEDVYLYNAARLFGLDLKKINKKTHFNERQIGKAIELGCGFGMGWAKLITTVAKEPYRLTWVEEEARRYVDFYRSSHQKVKDLWYATEKAAMNAVQNPGQPFSAGVNGKVTYFCAGGYLWCKLPSGRPLCYARPRIVERPVPWDKEQTRPAIEVEGVDSQTKQWIVYQLYGGILVENNVQAMARDIMAHGMTNVDKQGYPVILTSHDEVVSDVPLGFGSLADFERILCDTPAWAAGCPITSEGWEGPRYRK